MKTISLVLQFYNRRFELLKFEPQVNEIKEYIDSIIKKEKETNAKEKVLEVRREGTKFSWRELRFSVDANAVFHLFNWSFQLIQFLNKRLFITKRAFQIEKVLQRVAEFIFDHNHQQTCSRCNHLCYLKG